MNMNFYKLDRIRKYFASDNKNLDFVINCDKKSNVILSAPHAVSQVRLGKTKIAEIGSLKTILWLKENTGADCIIKTKNNFDDANWDEKSKYKDELFKLIENNNVKYLLDFHGLAGFRPCDVNLGTNLGRNVETDIKLFDMLLKSFEKAGIVVSIDQPFNAGNHTISGSSKIKYDNIWTLQVEINANITNRPENFVKFKKIIM